MTHHFPVHSDDEPMEVVQGDSIVIVIGGSTGIAASVAGGTDVPLVTMVVLGYRARAPDPCRSSVDHTVGDGSRVGTAGGQRPSLETRRGLGRTTVAVTLAWKDRMVDRRQLILLRKVSWKRRRRAYYSLPTDLNLSQSLQLEGFQ